MEGHYDVVPFQAVISFIKVYLEEVLVLIGILSILYAFPEADDGVEI